MAKEVFMKHSNKCLPVRLKHIIRSNGRKIIAIAAVSILTVAGIVTISVHTSHPTEAETVSDQAYAEDPYSYTSTLYKAKDIVNKYIDDIPYKRISVSSLYYDEND